MTDKILIETISADIAGTDEYLGIQEMYKQLIIPSLGRQIFHVVEQNGPTAAIFNAKRNENPLDTHKKGFKIIRNDVEIPLADVISTGISQEAIQDIFNTHPTETAQKIIGTLLRSLANEDENTKTLDFLKAQSVPFGEDLVLSKPKDAKFTFDETKHIVNRCILKINEPEYLSYKGIAVVPQVLAGAAMAQATSVEDFGTFYVGTNNNVRYFVNPDKNDNSAYVFLNPEQYGSASGYFASYMDDVINATDPDTGDSNYFIYNRFTLIDSPINDKVNRPLFMKFDVDSSAVPSNGTGGSNKSSIALTL